MAFCLCGSWRKTDFGFVCRLCGKKRSSQKTEKAPEFDAILNHLEGEFNDITPEREEDHHQVISYKKVGVDSEGNDILKVRSLVFNKEKKEAGKFPKDFIEFEWIYLH